MLLLSGQSKALAVEQTERFSLHFRRRIGVGMQAADDRFELIDSKNLRLLRHEALVDLLIIVRLVLP
jgi:hypothetical protein